MGKIAFVFPGQGAQYVGMGKEIVENSTVAKRVYEEASDKLGIDMSRLCFEGPDEDLVKTENTQPAILTTSVAILKALEKEGIDCHYTAGLSLGEYAALVKANVFDFGDAVRLVKNRGKYMQEAVPIGVGTMAAVLGASREDIIKCVDTAKQYGVVEIANYNSPGQIVISGEVEAVKMAVEEAIKVGAKKAVMLPVSAPFHCSLLDTAGRKLKCDLEMVNVSDPQKPVVANAEARVLSKREEIIPNLVKQVSSSVLWHDSIEVMMREDVDTFIEIGPGKSLTGFIKRIAKVLDKKVETYNVEDLVTFKKVVGQFS